MTAYWPSAWPGEDGGPTRRQMPRTGAGPGIGPGDRLEVTHRLAPLVTMVVLRRPGEVFLLRHSAGDGAFALVERIDPHSLEPQASSPELPGGPVWPGGLAAHGNGSLYVVFGEHAHRLDDDLQVLASRRLPRSLPYNSFVLLPDGYLVTKDFAGSRPGVPIAAADRRRSELLVLDPEHLGIAARLELPEPSVARLSTDGNAVYAVGDTSLLRVHWDGTSLCLDDDFRAPYRTLEGQTYGWDCVLEDGAAWFLDDGDGSERYSGTLRGHGVSSAPLHLVRVDLASAAVTTTEVCGLPGGLVANPPVLDAERRMAVAYDSGNGVLVGFGIGADGHCTPAWSRRQNHASHLLLFADTGELLTGDHDPERNAEQALILDITTGRERARADTGSPVQSVLFPAPGFGRDFYTCSFTTVSRLAVVSA
ncbi:MAG TPA: hypothetical protein VNC61_11955 [Acidimicrobiales bacterium]|nr:hypothetical protein [Acidimicrobiales bacterium]